MSKAKEKGLREVCQLLEDEYGIKTTEYDLRQWTLRWLLFRR